MKKVFQEARPEKSREQSDTLKAGAIPFQPTPAGTASLLISSLHYLPLSGTHLQTS